MKLTYGSVCSGIEAASVAWEPLNMKAEWFSEIEPFPCAVLNHHWPEVKNLGDMTTIADKLKAGEVTAPDVLVGGTPCQAFSVAGLRGGLSDERGQLTLSFVELADCIDEIREKDGKEPAIIVWENVPGVLSSKDNAFGCFLAGLAGESEELKPAGGKWSNAGVVSGPQRTVSWRILDAQYFGVPQRRRRVFVVATARKDISVAEILFEQAGMRGDIETSGAQAEAITSDAGECLASSNQTTGTILANCGAKHWSGNQEVFSGDFHIIDTFRLQSFGQYTQDDSASTLRSRDDKSATDLIVFNPQAGGKTSSTLGASSETVGCLQASQQPAIALASNTIGRKPENGGNQTGFNESDISYTLTKVDCHGVSVNNIVRRLTPIECERLQGFPDNHTKVAFKDKSIDDSPDGHRYRALGNSMAVPVMRWIGERICNAVAQAIPQSDYVKKLNSLKLQPTHKLNEIGDQWQSPENLVCGINSIYGPFTLDLFTDGENSKAPHFYTAEDNALTQDWSAKLKEIGGVAFGNPPYSRSSYHEKQAITGVRHIMSHASAMRELGGRYVFLLKAATSEVWWPENADHICFIRGRIGFDVPKWFIPADEKQKPTGAFFAGAIVVFDKTWNGKAFDYISREELEQRGKAFIEQAQWLAKKMGVAA
ncbi:MULTISPECIES: phage N-6-adenine-methyltransferase [Providencia]|uniref:phage N-6-adenine-methyltransferase n=1 Tax=Providencia TaxID=586 RepID=UPI001FD7AA5F|nr:MULTISPECIES: phage N-6-adenine-methyltransferase [Providencia]MDE4731517.1 phage N-6-adenine-methyltransferase [Providencia rettgeri]